MEYKNDLHHGELAPVRIDDKVWPGLPDGSKKVKYRLTRHQSFENSLGSAVNGRIIREKLPPLSYGGCFSWVIHYIISLCLHHPTNPILVGKSDFKVAYCRVSLHGEIAEKCTITLFVNGYVHLS